MAQVSHTRRQAVAGRARAASGRRPHARGAAGMRVRAPRFLAICEANARGPSAAAGAAKVTSRDRASERALHICGVLNSSDQTMGTGGDGVERTPGEKKGLAKLVARARKAMERRKVLRSNADSVVPNAAALAEAPQIEQEELASWADDAEPSTSGSGIAGLASIPIDRVASFFSAAVVDETAELTLFRGRPSRVNVNSFLRDCSHDAALMRKLRVLSNMSERAYYVEGLGAGDTWKRYGLHLVTSSMEYAKSGTHSHLREAAEQGESVPLPPFAWEPSADWTDPDDPELIFSSGDGMTVPTESSLRDFTAALVESARAELLQIRAREAARGSATDAEGDGGELVYSYLARAHGAIHAVDVALSLVASVRKTVRLPWGGSDDAVEGAEARAVAPASGEKVDRKKARAKDEAQMPPCEWFVCDHPSEPVRYITLQGSDSVDHWMTNLNFDPVVFEDGSGLGAKVHSGVYRAAERLALQLKGLMRDHMDAHGEAARFILTGHSLGGAIATVMIMRMVHAGFMRPDAIEGIYTFGAPAVICEHCCGGEDGEEDMCVGEEDCGCSEGGPGLLEQLGLTGRVHNVCMHRDIVPKAFSCNYTPVQSVLNQLDVFRTHRCLNGEGSPLPNLYQPIGEVFFLQPDSDVLTFANPEGFHPMLPSRPGLYHITEPHGAVKMAMSVVNYVSQNLQQEFPGLLSQGGLDAVSERRYAEDTHQAVLEMLNNPHPLEFLRDPAAYGHHGQMSRFHKPKNYTRALGALVNLPREGEGAGWE